jgi:hypothetical protein
LASASEPNRTDHLLACVDQLHRLDPEIFELLFHRAEVAAQAVVTTIGGSM